MKMRIFAILTIMTLFFGILPCSATEISAEESAKSNEYEILKSVGILQFSEDFKTEEGISCKDFEVLIANMFGSAYDSYSDAVANELRERGIEPCAEDKADALLTYSDAFKMTKSALESNITGIAKNTDGMIDMSELKKGISGGTKYISCNDALRLICNAVTMGSYVVKDFTDSDRVTVEFDKETSFLWIYRHICKVEGIVTETRQTGMYQPGALSGNDLKIAGVFYHSDTDRSEFFGVNVTAFADKSFGDDGTIIYMAEKENKNNVLKVESEDFISWNSGNTKFTYYADGKQKQAQIEKTAKFIYNGVILSDFTNARLMPQDGYIEFLDNNGDKKYDIVKINAYEYMVVDRVSKGTKEIKSKYAFNGALSELKLYLDDESADITITKNGNAAELKDIKEWDIAAVKRSVDGKVITVDVSDEKITAAADSTEPDDREVILNGKTYKTAKIFEEALENGVSDVKQPNRVDELTYYISTDGRIVCVCGDTLNKMIYGYVTKILYNDDTEEVRLRIFNENGNWNNYYLAEKVLYNSVSKKKTDVYNALCPGGITVRQLICYTLGSGGTIKRIMTAKETAEKGYDGFSKTPAMTYKWRINGHCFDSQVFVTNQPKIFAVPDNQSEANEESYFLSSLSNFSTDGEYTFEAYNVDEFGMSDMLVMTMDLKADVFAVVEKVTIGLNDDDEPIRMISGKIGDYANFTIPVANEVSTITDYYDSETVHSINTLKKGDILLLAIRGDGYVASIERLYSVSEGRKMHQTNEKYAQIKDFSNFTTSNSFDVANKYTAATTENINSEESLVLLKYAYDFGTRTQALKLSKTVTNYTVFDNETGKAKVGGFDDIDPGDYLFIRVHASRGKDVIIIKNLQ